MSFKDMFVDANLLFLLLPLTNPLSGTRECPANCACLDWRPVRPPSVLNGATNRWFGKVLKAINRAAYEALSSEVVLMAMLRLLPQLG
jgi:hypothetical protein